MAALPESRLRQMIDRFEQVEARMGVATDAKEIVQLSRDHAELKRVAEKSREVLTLRNQLAEAEALIEDTGADRDFVNMAIEELQEGLRPEGAWRSLCSRQWASCHTVPPQM